MTTTNVAPDIFEILDIEDREDSYSRLIVHLLRNSVGLRRKLLAHAFPKDAPPADPACVDLRHAFPGGRIVDIFLRDPASPPTWALFIESKLFSAEHGKQTVDYLASTRDLVGPSGKAAGIFLTIAGTQAAAPEVRSLTHRILSEWIAEHLADVENTPALHLAASAYTRRAQAPVPERTAAETLIHEVLHTQRWGLVPHLAHVAALGAALRHGLPGDWRHDAIWIQGVGHANPGLQFWLPEWCGTEIIEPNWTPNNIYVHLEVELTEAPPWRLKVHFETEPYYTQSELRQLNDHARFDAMRDVFRATLHAQAAQFPQWKVTSFKLQSAKLDARLGPDATVAQLRDCFAPAIQAIAPCITHALTQARAAVAATSPAP